MSDSIEVPKGVTEAELEAGHRIITSAFANGEVDGDVIKAAMFENDIPFSKLNKIYKYVTVSENLVVDPAVIKDGIQAEINSSEWSVGFDEWFAVDTAAKEITSKVNGATHSKVISMLRSHFTQNEMTFPKKQSAPKVKTGRVGKINRVYVSVFAADSKASKETLIEALKAVTKTEKNASDYGSSMHLTLYAVANGLSVEDAAKEIAKDVEPPVLGANEESVTAE